MFFSILSICPCTSRTLPASTPFHFLNQKPKQGSKPEPQRVLQDETRQKLDALTQGAEPLDFFAKDYGDYGHNEVCVEAFVLHVCI